ncbi:MAG: class I SAM-dependent DNA methyltransferase [Actinomycetota bacterium]
MSNSGIRNHAAFIWSVADLLRGTYKQSDYGKVILPLVVIRRLDCVLEPTKDAVLGKAKGLKGKVENVEPVLRSVAGQQFYNTSPLDFRRLLDDQNQIAGHLRAYIGGFSEAARDVIEKFDFNTQIAKLDKANLLYKVVARFADIDLHPEAVSNIEMGYLYEELIRRFSELSNETAGEHFTPREVIRLMVNLLFIEDEKALTKNGIVRTLFDPACGTGGMLSVAEDHLRDLNPGARLEVFGQELNDETYAVCRSDMMLKGQDASHIVSGNSFSEDGHKGGRFDYLLANPPFGVEWKNVEDEVKTEAATKGFSGRFGAGLPDIDDGAILFLQHMISKMRPPSDGGSRVAVVFNSSSLSSGDAGGRMSEIRRWIVEHDWLEADDISDAASSPSRLDVEPRGLLDFLGRSSFRDRVSGNRVVAVRSKFGLFLWGRSFDDLPVQVEFSRGQEVVECLRPTPVCRACLACYVLTARRPNPEATHHAECARNAPIQVVHCVDWIRVRPDDDVEESLDLMGRDDRAGRDDPISAYAFDDLTEVRPLTMLLDLGDFRVDGIGQWEDCGTLVDRVGERRQGLDVRRPVPMTGRGLGETDPVVQIEVDDLRWS